MAGREHSCGHRAWNTAVQKKHLQARMASPTTGKLLAGMCNGRALQRLPHRQSSMADTKAVQPCKQGQKRLQLNSEHVPGGHA